MPRVSRLHIPGGTFYLLQLSSRHQPLFRNADDCLYAEQLLGKTAQRSRTQIFAFCWLTHAMHLAARARETSISRFMQGFAGTYARYLHTRTQERGPVFLGRFASMLIDPDAWLPELVRFIHHAPARADPTLSIDNYPYSSHLSYLGTHPRPWLSTQPLHAILEARGMAREDIPQFLSQSPTEQEVNAFCTRSQNRLVILGDERFRQNLPHPLRAPRARQSLDELIDQVALAQSTSRAEILSASRRRDLALARSLIAWHAIERRIASLTEIAQRFSRSPSTLSKAIQRHREQHPHLFQHDALRHLIPLA